MLDSLITSKTRMRLLLKFFGNTNTKAYLRGLAEEFGESTNSIRVELNRLSDAGLLVHEQVGNTVSYMANAKNPFFKTLHKLVFKHMGVEDVVDSLVRKVGDLYLAFIKGDYAKGIDSGTIELVLVANKLDQDFLKKLHNRAEELTQRKIELNTYSPDEFISMEKNLNPDRCLILYALPESGYILSIKYE